jgi:hypothetical protein
LPTTEELEAEISKLKKEFCKSKEENKQVKEKFSSLEEKYKLVVEESKQLREELSPHSKQPFRPLVARGVGAKANSSSPLSSNQKKKRPQAGRMVMKGRAEGSLCI